MLNVVILNGGRGAGTVIPALLARQGLNVTSIVNAYDDGKSTGEIRRFFNMLGPSDLRKVQELMLPESEPGHDLSVALFAYRYSDGANHDAVLADMRAFAGGAASVAGIEVLSPSIARGLRLFLREFADGLPVIEAARGEWFGFDDCALMNCIYAGAFLANGRNMERTTLAIDRLFRLKGTVLPNSIENKWLVGLRENGEMLYCEADIVELRSNVRIESIYLIDQPIDRGRFEPMSTADKRYFLERHNTMVTASPGVVLALAQADIIVYSAGTQHSSLYPTYMSGGVARTIAANTRAVKVFVTNIGADYETPGYQASEYVTGALRYLRRSDGRDYALTELIDSILINTSRIKDDETYVDFDKDRFEVIDAERVAGDFESRAKPGRHDGDKLVSTILRLYEASNRT